MQVNKNFLAWRAPAQTRAHFYTHTLVCVIQCIAIILIITMHAVLKASDEAKPSADTVLVINLDKFCLSSKMADTVIITTPHDILRTFSSLHYWKCSFFLKLGKERVYITLILHTSTLLQLQTSMPVLVTSVSTVPVVWTSLNRMPIIAHALWASQDSSVRQVGTNGTNLKSVLSCLCVYFVQIEGDMMMVPHNFYSSHKIQREMEDCR